jgi:hypothetical protein
LSRRKSPWLTVRGPVLDEEAAHLLVLRGERVGVALQEAGEERRQQGHEKVV